MQRGMTEILFVYCRQHEDVSYRQGMHELLALILWVVDSDKLVDKAQPTDDTEQLVASVLDPKFVDHDAYIIFDHLMRTMRPWFETGQNVTASITAAQSTDPHVRVASAALDCPINPPSPCRTRSSSRAPSRLSRRRTRR